MNDEPTPDREQRLSVDQQLAVSRGLTTEVGAELRRVGQDLDIPTRVGWLIASPVVLGAALLIFTTVAWGVFDLVEPSGTTSTALVVSAALILIPAILAAWRSTTAAEHAQQVFQDVQAVVNPPSESPKVGATADAPKRRRHFRH